MAYHSLQLIRHFKIHSLHPVIMYEKYLIGGSLEEFCEFLLRYLRWSDDKHKDTNAISFLCLMYIFQRK